MAILAAAVLFLAGLGSGATASHLYRLKKARRTAPAAAPGPVLPAFGQRVELLRRLTARLNLTPDQRERIDQAIHESQDRLRALWEPIEPVAKEEVRRLRRRIEAELRPNQRERFESMLKERAARPPSEGPPWKRHETLNNPTSRTQRVPAGAVGAPAAGPAPDSE
jgi:hypothetical protein